MLIGLDRGHLVLIFLHWRAKLLDLDWPNAKLSPSRLVESAVSAFSWLFEKFCSEFSNARSLQILIFKPTYSVEKLANQAIG